MSSMLSEALRLAAFGYKLFPCKPDGKTPRTDNGLLDATSDENAIRFWFTNWPTCNLAVRTDGIVVVDVDQLDKKTTPRPNPWLSTEPEKAHSLLTAPTQTTWSGGRQHFFKQPIGRSYRNTSSDIAPGIDTRANGGYAVVAPSTVEDYGRSGQYAWISGCELEAGPDQLPEPPAWLLEELDHIEANRSSANASEGTRAAGPITEGRRNDTLYRLACRLRREGKEHAEIVDELDHVNATRCNPPLVETEVVSIAASACRHKPADAILQSENRTDIENSRRFAREHANDEAQVIRFVEKWGKWIVYTGKRWELDAHETRVTKLAKRTSDQLWDDTQAVLRSADQKTANALTSWNRYTASAKGISAMLRLARSEDNIVVSHSELDANPWLLNVRNGTVDLRTGRLQEHRRGDLLTQLAPVVFDANADCPRWEQFVDEIMDHDRGLVEFLQRLTGYWLSGNVSEHILPIFYGGGSNGKSVFLNTISTLLGPYAMKCPAEMLLMKQSTGVPTDIADLFGKRLACSIELQQGRRLNESLVKELTGGDAIKARRMREDFWEFNPTHKLVMACNHRPVIRGADDGIWRRIALVPFNVRFWNPDKGESGPAHLQQDKQLDQHLQAELSGILNWAIFGCLKWRISGSLASPNAIVEATRQYREDSDVLGEFITAKCCVGQDRQVPSGHLYEVYRSWCQENGIEPDNNKVFSNKLSERGFQSKHTKTGKVRVGIGLRVEPVE